jgi:hypothetical protein
LSRPATILIGFVGVPATAQSAPPTTVLAACGGKPEVRPTHVLFACGDGGVWADGVRWTQWGEQVAMATATMHANDCTPNCADGHGLPADGETMGWRRP